MPQQAETRPFERICRELRSEILDLTTEIKNLYDHPAIQDPVAPPIDGFEVHANLTLTQRHLEDARMRLGKAIQAFDGGKSVYPE